MKFKFKSPIKKIYYPLVLPPSSWQYGPVEHDERAVQNATEGC